MSWFSLVRRDKLALADDVSVDRLEQFHAVQPWLQIERRVEHLVRYAAPGDERAIGSLVGAARDLIGRAPRASVDVYRRAIELSAVPAIRRDQLLPELAEACLDELLPLDGSFVFAVLAQVAVLDRLPDLLGKGDVQLVLQLLDFFSQLTLQCLDHIPSNIRR